MNDIFTWTDPAGNIKADKAKFTEKIDGAVAVIMVLTVRSGAGMKKRNWFMISEGFLVF